MNTGKLVKFDQNVFSFFKIWFWKGQYDPFHTIIDKFYFVFKNFCCLWVLSPRIWNMLWMHFSKMNFRYQLKKMERWPRDTKRFWGFFLVENMLSPNIWDCPLNPTLNTWYKRLPSCSEVLHRFRSEDVLVPIRSNFYSYHFLWFLKKMFISKVMGSLFSIKCFT